MLSGTDLFLATAISATPTFDNAVSVPPEFTGTQLAVPHPVKGVLYLKLRDDPASQETLTLPVTPMTPAELAEPTAKPLPVAPTESPEAPADQPSEPRQN